MALLMKPGAVIFLIFAWHGSASADMTGVAFEISDMDSDWKFADGTRAAKTNSLSLQIEESTASGLTVGGGIGYLTMRVGGDSTTPSTKFEAEYLQVYLRQDFRLGESTAIEGLLSYGYHTGRENTETDRAEIEWSQVALEIGLSFQVNNLRITPFVGYANVDGDISGTEGSGAFELEDPFNQGVRFDVFVETTAFIRIQLQTGSQSGGYLSFVRRY